MFSHFHFISLLAAATLGVGAITATASEITIKGSDTMVILNQKWAQEYMKSHPNVNIQVTGGGSGTGIAALRNNTTDIAAASRLIKPKEVQDFLVNSGIKPIQFKTALDGVAVFVNQNNPISEISIPTLSKIFRGEITNWKQVGGADQPIIVYSRESNSGTYAFFKEEVLLEKDFTPKAQTLAGTAALIDAISKDSKGIGYGGIGYSHGVKALKLRKTDTGAAVEPTQATVEAGTYPLSRSLNYYLNPRSNEPEIDKFIKWVRSEAGQKIVLQVGFFPLPGTIAKTPVAAPVPVAAVAVPKSVEVAPAAPVVSTSTPTPVTGEMSAFVSAPPEAQPAPAARIEPKVEASTPTPVVSAPASSTTSPESMSALTGPVDPNKPLSISTSLIGQFRTMMAERERSVMFREESVAKREEGVAKRELSVAEREAALASREEKLAQVTQK